MFSFQRTIASVNIVIVLIMIMSKMASSKSKKSKEIKEEVEDKVNDEETTRLDKLKVGRKNYS